MVDRFRVPVRRLVSPPVAGDSEVAGTLVDVFSSFQQQAIETAAESQAQESRRAGLLAGAAGTPELRAGRTIAAQSFNEGAIAAFSARMKSQVAAQADQIVSDVSVMAPTERLGEFDARYAGMTKAMLDELDPQLRPEIETQLEAYALKKRGEVYDQVVKDESANQKAVLSTAIDLSIQEATTALFDGNAMEAEARAAEVDEFVARGIASGLLNAGEALAYQERMADESLDAFYTGEADRAYESGGGMAYALQLQDSRPEGMDLEDWERVQDKVVAHITDRVNVQSKAEQIERDRRAELQEQGEIELTSRILRAGAGIESPISELEIDEALRAGRITPAAAMRMRQHAVQTGPSVSSQFVLMEYKANLEDITVQEIQQEHLLTTGDRLALIDQKRSLPSWTSFPAYTEGKRTIRGALGLEDRIISSQTIGPSEEAILTNQALDEYYERMLALPSDSERRAKAWDLANRVKVEVFAGYWDKKVAEHNAAFDAARAERDRHPEGSRAWDQANASMQSAERKARQATNKRRGANVPSTGGGQ